MISGDYLPLPKNNPIETLHLMFCKHLLGVHKSTTTDGVLKELGRIPIALYAQKAAFKNWHRIRNNKANVLMKASYQNAKIESLKWVTNINKCLDSIGMTYIFLNNTDNTIHNKVFQRLCDIYSQQSSTRISTPDSKLRTYNLIKKDNEIQPYLINIKNVNYRKSLTKFRLSNHDLMIETGRYTKPKIPKENRFCPFCADKVEDEIHFLIICPTYNNLRGDILIDCTRLKPNFPYYSDTEKFMFLMSNEYMLYNVSKLIHLSMNKINALIASTS